MTERQRFTAGFTLIELLTVIAIISLLATLATVSLGTTRGYRVTSAASLLKANIELAKQTATSTGDAVEVRFYRETADPEIGYKAFRIVRVKRNTVTGDNEVSYQKMQRLEDGIVMMDTPIVSSLFYSGDVQDEQTPRGYVSGTVPMIRFLPDGSLEGLSAAVNSVWLSVVAENDRIEAKNLPANYATISIDTLLGTIIIYRP